MFKSDGPHHLHEAGFRLWKNKFSLLFPRWIKCVFGIAVAVVVVV